MVEEAASSPGWRGPRGEPDASVDVEDVPRIVAGEFPRAPLDRWAPPERLWQRSAGHGSRFAESLASAGDIDGDGIADLVVGAPADSFTGHAHGAAWLLFLDDSGGIRSAAELRELGRDALPRMNEFAQFGAAVVSLGDLDGNSVPDIAVGAPGWDGAGDHQGGVWVLLMERNGAIARGRDRCLARPGRVGVGEGSGLGASIACLGDLDRDDTI
jgi:hypothetical protein